MNDYKYFLDNGINDFNMNNIEQGIENLTKSIKLKKDFEISYFYRGACYQALELWNNAILDYTKAIQLCPTMTDAYYNRAKITLSRKDINNPNIDNAIKDLEQALKLDDKFIDALFAMAAAYKKKEDYHKSLEYLEKLLEIEPQAIQAKALKKLILQKYIIK